MTLGKKSAVTMNLICAVWYKKSFISNNIFGAFLLQNWWSLVDKMWKSVLKFEFKCD